MNPRSTSPSATAARWQAATGPLRAYWRTRAPRERRAAALGLAVLALGLLWFVALRPAWQATRTLPAEIDRLDSALQQMQRQAAETRSLRELPTVAPAQSAAALRASTQQLGDAARLSLVGDRATVTLADAEVDELQRWLLEAREGARARPVEVNLTRSPQGTFSGSVVLALPGAPS